MSISKDRVYSRIGEHDLQNLAQIALSTFEGIFRKGLQPAFKNNLRLICLCQGAADHYVNGHVGVHDFDIWGFFKRHQSHRWPPRVVWKRYYEPSGGDFYEYSPSLIGRRVDVMGRDIEFRSHEAASQALRRYILASPNLSPRLLAQRPIIGLWPSRYRGRILWRPQNLK